jgi:NTE family protein
MARLQEFWRRVQHDLWLDILGAAPLVGPIMSNLTTIGAGIPAFFKPNPMAFLGPHVPLGADRAGYYDTCALARTLGELEFGS